MPTLTEAGRADLTDRYLKLLARDELGADDMLTLEHLRAALGIEQTVEREAVALRNVNHEAEVYAGLPKLRKEAEKAQQSYTAEVADVQAKIEALQQQLATTRECMVEASRKFATARDSIAHPLRGFNPGSTAISRHREQLRAKGKLPRGADDIPAPLPDGDKLAEEVESVKKIGNEWRKLLPPPPPGSTVFIGAGRGVGVE